MGGVTLEKGNSFIQQQELDSVRTLLYRTQNPVVPKVSLTALFGMMKPSPG
jgi:hypothetical protein